MQIRPDLSSNWNQSRPFQLILFDCMIEYYIKKHYLLRVIDCYWHYNYNKFQFYGSQNNLLARALIEVVPCLTVLIKIPRLTNCSIISTACRWGPGNGTSRPVSWPLMRAGLRLSVFHWRTWLQFILTSGHGWHIRTI